MVQIYISLNVNKSLGISLIHPKYHYILYKMLNDFEINQNKNSIKIFLNGIIAIQFFLNRF